MRVSVTKAKGQLTELVRRVEAGAEVVLTRLGPHTTSGDLTRWLVRRTFRK
jgi:hypothetical protein